MEVARNRWMRDGVCVQTIEGLRQQAADWGSQRILRNRTERNIWTVWIPTEVEAVLYCLFVLIV